MSKVVLSDDQQRRVYQAILTYIVELTEGVKFYFNDSACEQTTKKILDILEEEIRKG